MQSFEELLTPNSPQKIEKGWGSQLGDNRIGEIYLYHQPDEKDFHQLKVDTVKALFFDKTKKLSLHFHAEKDEIFTVVQGAVLVETIEKSGQKRAWTLKVGERIFIPKFTPHRISGVMEKNILIEVSTLHKDQDSIRIEKGD